jgi:hypothetical protein
MIPSLSNPLLFYTTFFEQKRRTVLRNIKLCSDIGFTGLFPDGAELQT